MSQKQIPHQKAGYAIINSPLASLYVERSAFRTSLNRRNTPRISSLFFPEKEDFTFLPYLSFLERGTLSIWFLFFLHAKKEGAVSKWLKQAMRGSAFFRNIFGQTKTECRKNGTQGIIFIRNSKWNEL